MGRGILVSLLLVLFASCDTFIIVRGTLRDKETGKPVSGAKVYEKEMDEFYKITDANGNFRYVKPLDFFVRPKLHLYAEKEGYETTVIKNPRHKDTIYIRKLEVDSSCIPKPDLLNGEVVLVYSEIMPEFPGGDDEMRKYITKNLNVGNDNEQPPSKIIVTFIIDTAGNLVNPCIQRRLKSEGFTGLEESLITIFTEMPLWQPGQQNGKKVNVRMNVPVWIHFE